MFSTTLVSFRRRQIPEWTCDLAGRLGRRMDQLTGGTPQESGRPCTVAYEGIPAGAVRHFLPGKNPFLDEMTRLYNLPRQAVLGGAETMYPEYRKKLKDSYVIPMKCLTPNVREGILGCGGPGTYPRIPR